jgi:hypothetical protein
MECVYYKYRYHCHTAKIVKNETAGSEGKEKYRALSDEYDMFRKNITNFVRKKNNPPTE